MNRTLTHALSTHTHHPAPTQLPSKSKYQCTVTSPTGFSVAAQRSINVGHVQVSIGLRLAFLTCPGECPACVHILYRECKGVIFVEGVNRCLFALLGVFERPSCIHTNLLIHLFMHIPQHAPIYRLIHPPAHPSIVSSNGLSHARSNPST